MAHYSIEDLKIEQGVEREFRVEEEMGKKFAELSKDFNPLHIDEQYAKKTRFQGKIAHGMLIGSFISGVIGNVFPGEGSVYMKQDFKFVKPVRYGDIIKVCVTVSDIKREKAQVELQTDCYNQKEEKVLTGKALVMME